MLFKTKKKSADKKENVSTIKTKKEIKPVAKSKEEIKQENQRRKEELKIINKLVMNWQNTFGNLKNWNQERNGYTLDNIEVTDYGLKSRIYAPWGLDLFNLEKYTSVIESGCKCEFIYTIPQHKQFALAKFIYPEQVKINEKEYIPVKVKPWECCCGYDVSGEPIKFNLNDTPHILIAGQQRRGKNGAADHAIINWIYSCDETEITFYMFQCAKNDLIKYKNCKQVYCYADNLKDILTALEHILKEMNRRTGLFESMVSKAEGNDNIFHYNKLHPQNKLPYIIIIIDEFIELMPDNTVDDQGTKDTKNKIMKHLQQVGQWGGSLGINYLPLHQKPEKALMPTFIKNQSSIRICFGFEDLTCCAIVLGDELAKYAHKLPPRKAYFSNNEYNGYLYTSNLKGRINMFIKDSIQPNHRTLFEDLKKLSKIQEPIIKDIPIEKVEEELSNKSNIGTVPLPNIAKNIPNANTLLKQQEEIIIPETKLDITYSIPKDEIKFDKVDPIKIASENEKIVNENIKNNPNFVPFNPDFKPKVVIDQTKIDFSKTQKPIKKSKEVIDNVIKDVSNTN